MKVEWGISANSHDAALAVFVDNQLAFASHSERFSGIKNDPNLHAGLVDYALRWGTPDRIFWYENPYKKTLRQWYAGQGWRWGENNIPKYLKRWALKAPITFTDHHLSHAAAGYYTSKFDQACVVVLDSIGEWNTLTIWSAEGTKLKKVYEHNYPNSVGLWYSAMTHRIGLKPQEDEYILMGMAAYGNPDVYESAILEDLVSFSSSKNIVEFKENLHRGCLHWRPDLTEKDYFDIAAATQQVYEKIFVRTLDHARKLVDSENLVLMGGCALNCLANRLTGDYFSNTWIMPNPGDAGSSIGAVLAHKKQHIDFDTALIGFDMGSKSSNEEIVQHLLDHQICGLARGRAEFGPRALGNRSLIADPRGSNIKDKVNEIKHRQQFRPFAPAILEEHVSEYFDMPNGWSNSRYMQVIATCRHPDLFPAIVHRDNTSRVQTVPKDDSPFRQLLGLWYEKTGCPMLLNTSLNIKGEPMVNDHRDARRFEERYNVKVFN